MKKLLSLIMILAVVFPNPGIYANAQPPVNSFEQMIRLYEIWPESFAEEINKYVSAAEHYIIHSPNAEAAELASLRANLKAQEEFITKVLKKKSADTNFLDSIYRVLSASDWGRMKNHPFSLAYTKETVGALTGGKTPLSAVNVLKAQPEFFNKAAFTMLEKGEKDFALLVKSIEKNLTINRKRAVSLALSAEVEYAHSISGGRISALREQISHNKYWIRKADYKASKQVELWRKEIRAAEKEILELKKMHNSARRTISYALGEEELNKVMAIVRQTDPALASALSRDARAASTSVLRNMKALKSVLPLAIGAGLFMTVFAANANAASAQAEQDVIRAVSNRTALKREVLTAVNQNPANIGVVYAGGPQVKNMLAELFESESNNSLSAEKLLPYAEEWSARMHTLATNNQARTDYIGGLKRVYQNALNQDKVNFNRQIKRDLTLPADNTRVERQIHAEFIRFKK